MKQKLIGFAMLLALTSPFGCISDKEIDDLDDGPPGGSDVNPGSASGTDMLTGVLGGLSSDEVSKRDLLATLIDFYAASSDSSDSEALLWEVAASAARDGRAGVKRSVAEFVVGQIVTAAAEAATPATP